MEFSARVLRWEGEKRMEGPGRHMWRSHDHDEARSRHHVRKKAGPKSSPGF